MRDLAGEDLTFLVKLSTHESIDLVFQLGSLLGQLLDFGAV